MGSIEVGKFADLVLWTPSFFGTKPDLILKGGIVAWAQMGDANASIPTPEPVMCRRMYGSSPSLIQNRSNCLAFVSKISVPLVQSEFGLGKSVKEVKGCRQVKKKDMKWNNTMPQISVDPETYEVMIDGKKASMEPARSVPLSTNYYLF